jgi:hypothetical protein
MERHGRKAKSLRAFFRSRWFYRHPSSAYAFLMSFRFRRDGQLYYHWQTCRHQMTFLNGTLFEAAKLLLTT